MKISTMFSGLLLLSMLGCSSGSSNSDIEQIAQEFNNVNCERMIECAPEMAVLFGSSVQECVTAMQQMAQMDDADDTSDSDTDDCLSPDMTAFAECLECQKTQSCEDWVKEPNSCTVICDQICSEGVDQEDDVSTQGNPDGTVQPGDDAAGSNQEGTDHQVQLATIYCSTVSGCTGEEFPDMEVVAQCIMDKSPDFCEEYSAIQLPTCQICLTNLTCDQAQANVMPDCMATDCACE
jgi:hypothetical protein